jgi:hypothetical protein
MQFNRKLLRRLLLSAFAVLWLAGASAVQAADELTRLYALVLKNPTNTEINLRYASAAEAAGKPRWALAAYERILLNDSANTEAKRGLERIQRRLVPVTTEVTTELGTAWESNPRYQNSGTQPEMQLFGTLRVRDDRMFGDLRWRTNGLLTGIVHQKESDLNYGYAGVVTGPMFDFLPGTSLHLAGGGGVSSLSQKLFYSEAVAAASVITHIDGVFRSLDVRYGYRDYNDSFTAPKQGSYVDAKARFAFRDIFNTPATLLATPWARYSDVGGSATNLLLLNVQPGAYSEWGGRLELVVPANESVFMGPTAVLWDRYYRNDIAFGATSKRHDTIYGPGFLIWIPNAVAFQTGLKVEYQYLRDKSNDPTHSFHDHLVMTSVVSQF